MLYYYRSILSSVKKFYYYFMIAVKGDEKEFTTGSIDKAIFLLAVPMVLEMVLESMFAVVDVFFVSKISVNAVATVGLTESMMMIIYSIVMGLSMAATAMVARRIGENNPEDASRIAAQAMLIGFVLTVVISIVGFVYAEDILRLLGGSEQLISEGKGFTRIMFTTNAVIIFIFLLNGIFRGAGDAAIAMRTLWISNGLNIILDPLLIFGYGPFPEMGLEGAAVATSIGRGTGVLYQLYHLFNGKSIIKITVAHFRAHWDTIKKLLEISAGGTGQFLIETASWIFMVRIISVFGSEALAGYTIAFRVIVFSILPSFGLANAAATLVGQNLGAQQPERAEQSVWRTSFFTMIFLGVLSVIYFIFASFIVSLFTNEMNVIPVGTKALQMICIGYVFFAYGMVISQALNGAGDTKTPTFINLFCFWLVQIPLAYLLAVTFNMGPTGVFVTIGFCFSLHALVCIYVFRLGKWKTISI